MKNIAEFKGADKLASKLLEIFAALAGNGKSFDPPVEGVHQVVVIKAEERLSSKGKEMKEIKVRSINDGRDATFYIMKFRKQDWKTWQDIQVGQELNITLKYNNGFPNVTINQKGAVIDILPEKPNKALTNQTIYIYDIEVFKKDNLFVFRNYFTKEWTVIHNDLDTLRKFYLANRDSLFVGYNSASYDNNVLRATLQGKNPYHVSKAIIESDDRGLVYKMFDTKKTPVFGMDLYQDNRGFSLKEYSAFMGINIKETDVDFDLDRELTEEEQVLNELYCKNDVLATELRFEQHISMLLAKATLIAMYDLDKTALLMTNANLTATILGAIRQEDRGDERSYFELPSGFAIENEIVLSNMTGNLPEKIDFTVHRRDVDITLGEGGSHSAKDSYINTTEPMYHNDATSLHPSSMLLFNLESRNIPKEYLGKYQTIVNERVKAKHNKKNMINVKGVELPGWILDMGLKLPLNGTYGAMGAEFNKLYDPRQRLLVCLVGQLAFFDLLEKLEPHGTIIQTNTDAIDFTPFSDEDYNEAQNIMRDWEKRTGYEMDSEKYVEMFQKDCNNYIQRMADDTINIKGAIGLGRGLKISKAIVSNAFINYLIAGKDYREYIYECEDLRQFQIITKTGFSFDDTIYRDGNGNEFKAQKVNRTFAIKDPNKAVEIFKVKRGAVIEDEGTSIVGDDSYTKGLPNAPEYYAIDNGAIGEGWINLDDIDKEYYINQVEDLLVMWFGSNYKERVEEARKRGDVKNGKLEVREYIKG